jgi:hypothetical protein
MAAKLVTKELVKFQSSKPFNANFYEPKKDLTDSIKVILTALKIYEKLHPTKKGELPWQNK